MARTWVSTALLSLAAIAGVAAFVVAGWLLTVCPSVNPGAPARPGGTPASATADGSSEFAGEETALDVAPATSQRAPSAREPAPRAEPDAATRALAEARHLHEILRRRRVAAEQAPLVAPDRPAFAAASAAAAPPGRRVGITRRDGATTRGAWRNGKRHGLWVETDAAGGRSENEYVDGEKHGVEAAWRADGTPRFAGRFEHGKMTGTWTSWGEGGVLSGTRQYVDGKISGVAQTFHPNGTLAAESTYLDGKDVAPTRGWYDDGSPEFEMPYADGLRQGEAVWWHRNGAVRARGTYVDGELHGTYTEWDADGRETLVEAWEHGVRR